MPLRSLKNHMHQRFLHYWAIRAPHHLLLKVTKTFRHRTLPSGCPSLHIPMCYLNYSGKNRLLEYKLLLEPPASTAQSRFVQCVRAQELIEESHFLVFPVRVEKLRLEFKELVSLRADSSTVFWIKPKTTSQQPKPVQPLPSTKASDITISSTVEWSQTS